MDLDSNPRSNSGLPGKMEFTLSVVYFLIWIQVKEMTSFLIYVAEPVWQDPDPAVRIHRSRIRTRDNCLYVREKSWSCLRERKRLRINQVFCFYFLPVGRIPVHWFRIWGPIPSPCLGEMKPDMASGFSYRPASLCNFAHRCHSILTFTLMRIRILASKYMLKSLKKCSNRLIFHTFRLVIFKLMRIGIQIITLLRILPFNLMRIRIRNTCLFLIPPRTFR